MLKNWIQSRVKYSKGYQDKAFKEVNELVIQDRCRKKITLTNGKILTEFVSCSYLGLDQDIRILNAVSSGLERIGFSFHAARTRIQPKENLELETLLHQLYFGAFPLTFPALHMVHAGFLPLLASGEVPSFPVSNKGAVFLMDKTAHSSIQINRGMLEQFGTILLTNFQEIERLGLEVRAISCQKRTPILIGDSIGSMGGMAPIKELLLLADQFNGYVYLDDAHGTSVHGKQGSGYVLDSLGYQFHPRLILTATLGKAFGAMGGVLLLPTQEDIQFTKEFSPTYVFAGPVAFPVVNAAIASAKIHLTPEIDILQATLWENVRYFDLLAQNHLVNLTLLSPIRGILVGDELKAICISKELHKRGFAVTTAIYPTVPKYKSMLRVALSALHQKSDILSFWENLQPLLETTQKITQLSTE